jgi:integrase
MKDGAKHELGLGSYPLVSLSTARQKRDVLKGQLALGDDPFTLRKQTAEKIKMENKHRFSMVAERVIQSKRKEWTCPKQEKLWRNSLQTYVNPLLDTKPLAKITQKDIIQVLEPIWDDKAETARKIMGRIGKVFGYAIVQGWYNDVNPAVWTNNLEMVFRPNHTIKHHPSLNYTLVPDFYSRLLQIDTLASLALRFTILTVARTKETILATRSDFRFCWIVLLARHNYLI